MSKAKEMEKMLIEEGLQDDFIRNVQNKYNFVAIKKVYVINSIGFHTNPH